MVEGWGSQLRAEVDMLTEELVRVKRVAVEADLHAAEIYINYLET